MVKPVNNLEADRTRAERCAREDGEHKERVIRIQTPRLKRALLGDNSSCRKQVLALFKKPPYGTLAALNRLAVEVENQRTPSGNERLHCE